MTDFKPGDWVRITNPASNSFNEAGFIAAYPVYGRSYDYEVQLSHHKMYVPRRDIERMSEFKVGDKVKVLTPRHFRGLPSLDGDILTIGKTFTVEEGVDGNGNIRVHIPGMPRGVPIGVNNVEKVEEMDFKPGDRIRGTIEGVISHVNYDGVTCVEVGDEYIRLSDISNIEKIKGPLPTEPGSVATFAHTDNKNEPFQGILFGGRWRRLDSSDLNACIHVDDKEIDIVSIDRVGV